jgi:hemoglobin-like flavoprotein
MNTNQIQLVQSTFNTHVAPLGDAAAKAFYQNLFAIDPSLQAMFKSDMALQGHRLVQTLALAVNNLHAPEPILDAVRQLGQRHVGYGVQAGHYDTVGQALLQTLQTAIGPAFTGEIREAWVAAYTLLAGVMQSPEPTTEAA